MSSVAFCRVLQMDEDVIEQIRTIEGHSARAWPAQTSTSIVGWELRLSPILSSKRTNSLNAVTPEAGRFAEALQTARMICHEQKVPCHVRLHPLGGQEPVDHLRALGLNGRGETTVEVLDLTDPYSVDQRVVFSDSLSDLWLDTNASTHDHGETERNGIRDSLASVAIPQGFAVACDKGVPCAVGRAALDEGLMGIFQIATLPSARRKGLGLAVVTSLLEWGQRNAATKAYLQVESGNIAARNLYEGLGFRPLYTYDYWTLPPL